MINDMWELQVMSDDYSSAAFAVRLDPIYQPTVVKTAVKLFTKGHWPVILRAPGEDCRKDGTIVPATGKEPVDTDWGLHRPSETVLCTAWEERPDRGLGVVLGPDGGLIDLDGDGPRSEDTLARLFEGEITDTASYRSRRGRHRLYLWDDRCRILKPDGTLYNIIKGDDLPDLEIRLGAMGQLQSAIPPTISDGFRRQWLPGMKGFHLLPNCFFVNLHAILAARRRPERLPIIPVVAVDPSLLERRIIPYLRKVPPAISGQQGHTAALKAAAKIGPGFDISAAEAFRYLKIYYNPTCIPEWTDADLMRKIQEAEKIFTERGWLKNADHPDWNPTRSNGRLSTGNHSGSTGEGSNPQDEEPTDEDLGIMDLCRDEAEPVDWLFEDVLGIGKLTLVAGTGSVGKSQLGISFATTISVGGSFPCELSQTHVGRTLILAAEDGRKDTIIPRLVAAGADLSRVHVITAKEKIKVNGETLVHPRSFQDLMWWAKIFQRRPGVRLIIADTLPSYMGAGVNDKSNLEVRRVLEPFQEFLNDHGVAMFGIMHTGKSTEARDLRSTILDSVAYPNTARLVYFAMKDPEATNKFFFCADKNNVGGIHPTMTYTLEPFEFLNETTNRVIKSSRITWDPEYSPLSSDDVYALQKDKTRNRGRKPAKANEEAITWIRSFLEHGPQLSEHVFTAGIAAGFTRNQLYNIFHQAGASARKVPIPGQEGREAPWWWGLGQSYDWLPLVRQNPDTDFSPPQWD